MILRSRSFDAGEALRTCDQAPGGRAVDCYESIGLQITGLFQHDDAWVLAQCARGRPDLAAHCAAGAARALVQIDWSGERAAELCRASPAAWKDACYRKTGEFLSALASPARRAALCARIEQQYLEVCRQAAGLDLAS